MINMSLTRQQDNRVIVEDRERRKRESVFRKSDEYLFLIIFSLSL